MVERTLEELINKHPHVTSLRPGGRKNYEARIKAIAFILNLVFLDLF